MAIPRFSPVHSFGLQPLRSVLRVLSAWMVILHVSCCAVFSAAVAASLTVPLIPILCEPSDQTKTIHVGRLMGNGTALSNLPSLFLPGIATSFAALQATSWPAFVRGLY
jgi:hypothetical protein